MNDIARSTSPHWNNTVKIVVGLISAGMLFALIFRFKYLLTPLIVAFLLAYLFLPIANFLNQKLKIPWKLASTIIFLLLFSVLIGLIVWGGVSIVDQAQNLVDYLSDLWGDLPSLIENQLNKSVQNSPFYYDPSNLDLKPIWTQLQSTLQSILSTVGTLAGSIASGVGSTVMMILFVLLIGYFLLAESGGVRNGRIKVNIPGYQEDFLIIGRQFSLIWNSFFRGQLLVFFITIIFYTILLSILGVKYFLPLAILSGLARFVPYVGPFIAWTSYALVALFQINIFGLPPIQFALLVVGCAVVVDLVIDYYISPKVMSNALHVHPAAVLVMVFISGSLFGFIGFLLAAPLLASLNLIVKYILRKILDLDPWEDLEMIPQPEPASITLGSVLKKISIFFLRKKKIVKSITKPDSDLKRSEKDR